MLSVLFELAFGVFLFLASLVLIPRLLSGDRKIYEIAVPFAATLIISILITNNLNLSLLIATIGTAVIYYIRKKECNPYLLKIEVNFPSLIRFVTSSG